MSGRRAFLSLAAARIRLWNSEWISINSSTILASARRTIMSKKPQLCLEKLSWSLPERLQDSCHDYATRHRSLYVLMLITCSCLSLTYSENMTKNLVVLFIIYGRFFQLNGHFSSFFQLKWPFFLSKNAIFDHLSN